MSSQGTVRDTKKIVGLYKDMNERAIATDENLKAELLKTFTPEDIDILPAYIKKYEEDYEKAQKKWYVRPAAALTVIIFTISCVVLLAYAKKSLFSTQSNKEFNSLIYLALLLFIPLGFFLVLLFVKKKRIPSMTREERLRYYAGLEVSERATKDVQEKTKDM